MASKRVITSIPSIAKLGLPSRASPCRALLRSDRRHIPVYLPSAAARLFHGIPRPRNSAPFKQEPQPTTNGPQESTTPTLSSTLSSTPQQQPPSQTRPNIQQQPHYELTFTCRPCDTRSRHRVSKQGYHHGSVLIACPSCKNRHVISDHLRIFGDAAMTVEDILRSRGELVKRGTLGEDGDLEFWDDGSSTVREPWVEPEGKKETKGGEDLPPGATFKSVRPGEKKGEGKEE